MEKRLMRLVWNDRNWITPIYKKHNPSKWKDGKTNASHEKSYGFGGEEWLFNSRFYIDGFQYGFVRGADNLPEDLKVIDELYLYTIEAETKKRLLVYKIYDVEIFDEKDEVQKTISPIIKKSKNIYIDDLKSENLYYKALNVSKIRANIRFKLENVENLGYNTEIDALSTSSYNRFTPYIVNQKLEAILNKEIEIQLKFTFKKGKAKSTIAHSRNIQKATTFNIRYHSEIIEDLYKYLHEFKNIDKEGISIEKSRVGDKIVDGVINNNGKLTLFEAKTSSFAIANIREAIGQLLEYSLLDKTVSIEKLVIVGPAKLKNNFELEYLERIRGAIKFKIEYWAYITNQSHIKNRFKIY